MVHEREYPLLLSYLFDQLLESQVVMGKLILVLQYLSQGIHPHAYEKLGSHQNFKI